MYKFIASVLVLCLVSTPISAFEIINIPIDTDSIKDAQIVGSVRGHVFGYYGDNGQEGSILLAPASIQKSGYVSLCGGVKERAWLYLVLERGEFPPERVAVYIIDVPIYEDNSFPSQYSGAYQYAVEQLKKDGGLYRVIERLKKKKKGEREAKVEGNW